MDKTATPDRSSTNPIQVIERPKHASSSSTVEKCSTYVYSPNNLQYLRLQVEVGVVTEEKEREVAKTE